MIDGNKLKARLRSELLQASPALAQDTRLLEISMCGAIIGYMAALEDVAITLPPEVCNEPVCGSLHDD